MWWNFLMCSKWKQCFPSSLKWGLGMHGSCKKSPQRTIWVPPNVVVGFFYFLRRNTTWFKVFLLIINISSIIRQSVSVISSQDFFICSLLSNKLSISSLPYLPSLIPINLWIVYTCSETGKCCFKFADATPVPAVILTFFPKRFSSLAISAIK